MKYFISILTVFISIFSFGQREHHVDLTYTHSEFANSIAGNVVKNFKLLKSEKLHLGVGARAGFIKGTELLYLTAPAKHKKSDSGIDTVKVFDPMFISINLSFNASYHFTPSWSIGCNVDAIGFTFGKKRNSSDYFPSADAQKEDPARTILTEEQVRPSQNNFLLLGNYNRGTLYSEVFMRYRYQERYSLKLGYSFITTEYSSKNRIGHNGNYRFRNTSGQILVGFGYSFI